MRVERFIEIDAPVESVFDAFSDFENIPLWMSNVRKVRRTGRRTTRWTADAPSDAPFEWDVETTVYEPDRRIVWRSVGGDVDTDGEMVLQETQHGTTLMRLVISYYPTGSQNGPAVARFFGRNAEQQLEEDLERLKRDLERRSASARRAQRDLDERASHRALRHADEGDARESRPLSGRLDPTTTHAFNRQGRRDERAERAEPHRDSRFRVDYAPDDYRARRGGNVRDDERERRFDEALREARRSQLESMRRYDEERERARRRRASDEEDDRFRQSLRAGSETRGRFHEDDEPRGDETGRRPQRHALTPRERERDTVEREPDYGTRDRMLRRGVDRLLDDDAPSSRWRRRD